ncbi:MAG TPA: molybdenum cofactor guanylyltransferase [Nitrososphaerales archaeon]|nr:molybdenum cofactor guanylyltransferase [Nitrososphaerales archaeon]
MSAKAPVLGGLSVVVLAGGQSRRMGADKAFLTLHGRPFISLIVEEASKVSDDVIVMIGRKEESRFREAVGGAARVSADSTYLTNPMGGIVSALPLVTNEYSAFLACDTPFVKADVIRLLWESAKGRDAAVPAWEDGRIEPLCAVYSVAALRVAIDRALAGNKQSLAEMIGLLRRVDFVKVDELREVDPDLQSFKNYNSREEFDALKSKR